MRTIMIRVVAIASISFLVISCATPAKKKLIPDGKEYYTLLSAAIEPNVITTKGSDIIVSYRVNTPIDESNITPVAIILATGMTITMQQHRFPRTAEQYRHRISNPEIRGTNLLNYGKGQLSGSGTIHVFLEREVNGARERVSNVLSVYATFKP